MSGKNIEKYDCNIIDEAPFNRLLSKYFLRPYETPEAELARLVDLNKKFDYTNSLFYKVRSGQLKYGDAKISRPPQGSEWWDMPWLHEKQIHNKRLKGHDQLSKIFHSFVNLFHSIKSNGFVVDCFDRRIRSDKLTLNGKSCYIYVDANKRMGILGYLIQSGQLDMKTVPVRLARCSSSTECSWMSSEKSFSLFAHPFKVLGD